MSQKRPISFRVHPSLATRFQQAIGPYYGKQGACFSAALLMFLEADPKTQGDFLKRIYEAEINDEVDEVTDLARANQLKKIKARDDASRGKKS